MQKKLLILGDSLSAGYGMPLAESWPYKIQQQWAKEQPQWTLINASVSGETSAGALARLPDLIAKHQPHWVFVELGGNDGLRGVPIQDLERQLQQVLKLLQQHNIQVLLSEIEIPMNFGPRYRQAFKQVYHKLAQENPKVVLVPFFLAELALNPKYMQADQIHPNQAAQPKIVEFLRPYFEQALSQ